MTEEKGTKIEVVKTYDNVGNVSEKMYLEDSQGDLAEIALEGKLVEKDQGPTGLNRIYYDFVSIPS